jgi:hypothetical protein
MAVLTGNSGALQYRGRRVSKVRDWSLSVGREAQETTCLGTHDRSYVPGLRGATGSATCLYDPSDTTTSDLLNSIFDDRSESAEVDFVLNMAGGQAMTCQAFLTAVSPSVAAGQAVAVSVNFQVTGQITGRF